MKELLNQGIDVRGFVLEGTELGHLDGMNVEIVWGNLLNKASLFIALKGVDAVIHLAAAVRDIDWDTNYNVNVIGSKNLIECCEELGIKRVIFTSTVSVTRKKLGPYGKTKVMAEELFKNSSLDYTIFRPTIIYGLEGKGIWNIITYIKKFPFFIPIVGNGIATRQPIYVYDLAKTMVDCISNENTYRKLYPLAGKEIVPFNELVDVVAKELGVRKIKIHIPLFFCKFMAFFLERLPKPPFTAENVRSLSQSVGMDLTELINDTRFNPRSLREGIRLTINEMKESGKL